MTVLGWTKQGAPVPQGVESRPMGPLCILHGQTRQALSARERLALQVMCFDAGCDLLPVSPAQDVSLQDAMRLAQTTDLSVHLRRLEGAGQLTLSLKLARPDASPATDGRGWLAARKARQDHHDHCARLLSDITEQIGHPAAPMRPSGAALTCDLLVPRAKAPAVKSRLSELAKRLDAPQGTSLMVTGLCPPFGFAMPPSDRSIAA